MAASLLAALLGLLSVAPAGAGGSTGEAARAHEQRLRDATAVDAALVEHALTRTVGGRLLLEEFDDHADVCPPVSGEPRDPEEVARLIEEGRELFSSTTAFSQGESAGPTVIGERLACISCHQPPGYTDGRTHLVGPTAERPLVPRHTPHLLQIADTGPYAWDGRFDCLQATIKAAILSPLEMNAGRPPTQRQLDALAAFVETLDAPDAVPGVDYDPDLAAWGERLFADYRGRDIEGGTDFFDGIACIHCHVGPKGTDRDFHRIIAPLPLSPVALDPGKVDEDGRIRGFKTPVLRGVRLTAPYFHDGLMGQPTGVRIPFVDEPPIGALLIMMEAYERRFLIDFTPQERLALVHYLLSL
jgi:hypothetical protein